MTWDPTSTHEFRIHLVGCSFLQNDASCLSLEHNLPTTSNSSQSSIMFEFSILSIEEESSIKRWHLKFICIVSFFVFIIVTFKPLSWNQWRQSSQFTWLDSPLLKPTPHGSFPESARVVKPLPYYILIFIPFLFWVELPQRELLFDRLQRFINEC